MPAILGFFASKVGMYALIAVIAGGFLIGVRQTGYNSAQRKCEAAAKQREIDIAQRDVKIGELQARESERLVAEQSKTEDIDNAVQSKLEAELAKRKPADRCELSKPDADRLR
ncbi:MAG: hypothetical protein WC807_14480 [Hyphomicrobium sp.]|jgi:hypothetical protein